MSDFNMIHRNEMIKKKNFHSFCPVWMKFGRRSARSVIEHSRVS